MSSLLGKELPGAIAAPSLNAPRQLNAHFLVFGLLLLVAGAFQIGQLPLMQHAAPTTAQADPYAAAVTQRLADYDYSQTLAGGPTVTKTAPANPPAAAPKTPAAAPAALCDEKDYGSKFNVKSPIFPILPKEILTSDTCSPPYWNLTIFKILLYKGFQLLNYIIEVTAIFMTIYAGILYLSGFSNEKNVATAKTILVSTYLGLALSLSATLILKTTIGVFADQKNGDAIKNNEDTIFHGQ